MPKIWCAMRSMLITPMIVSVTGWVIEIASIEKQASGKYHIIWLCPQFYNTYADLKFLAGIQILGSVPVSNLWNLLKIIAHFIVQS